MKFKNILKSICLTSLLWACKSQTQFDWQHISKAQLYQQELQSNNPGWRHNMPDFNEKNSRLLSPDFHVELSDFIQKAQKKIHVFGQGDRRLSGDHFMIRLSDQQGQKIQYIINQQGIIDRKNGLIYSPTDLQIQDWQNILRQLTVLRNQK